MSEKSAVKSRVLQLCFVAPLDWVSSKDFYLHILNILHMIHLGTAPGKNTGGVVTKMPTRKVANYANYAQ